MRSSLVTIPVVLALAALNVRVGDTRSAPARAAASAPGAPDSVVAVTFTRRFALGGEGNPPLDIAHLSPNEIAGDSRGHVYALDKPRFRVVGFDKKGKQVASLGRKGSADGEFLEPLTIGVDTKGSIYVADVQREVLVGYADDGYILPTISTKLLGAVQKIAFLDVGDVVLTTELRDSLAMFRIDPGKPPVHVRSEVLPEKQLVSWKSCGMLGQTSAPLFWPYLVWTASGTSIAYVEKGTSRIQLDKNLKSGNTLDHELPIENADVSTAKRILGDSIRMALRTRTCTIATEQVADQAGISPTVPAYSAIAYDYIGHLWAFRNVRVGDATRADVFTGDGYAGTIDLGRIRPVAFTGLNGIVSLESDAKGAPMLVIYDFAFPKPPKKKR